MKFSPTKHQVVIFIPKAQPTVRRNFSSHSVDFPIEAEPSFTGTRHIDTNPDGDPSPPSKLIIPRANKLLSVVSTLPIRGRTLSTLAAAGAFFFFLLAAPNHAQTVPAAEAKAASGGVDEGAAPIYRVKIPPGYRDWKMIAVDHLVTDKVDQLRAQLGNDIAIKAFKEGKVPFPDGAIIVALHWTHVPSEGNNKVLAGPFPGAQSFVVGSPVNMQVMVKDSKRYAATGGWGFADFKDGKPGSEALHKTCFLCHEPAKDRDFVFTRYAP